MGQGAGGADLYDPAFEKDSCGFGLIAQLDLGSEFTLFGIGARLSF